MTTLVRGIDVQVGDDLLFLGRPHRILRTEPYDTTALFGEPLPGARLAHGADGWAITLLPAQHFTVERAQVPA